MTTCECGSEMTDVSGGLRQIVGDSGKVWACIACGTAQGESMKTLDDIMEDASSTLVEEEEADTAIRSFFGKAYEVGFVSGVSSAVNRLKEQATPKGRMRRLQTLWPPDTETKWKEFHSILFMGDQQNGS